MKRGDLAASPIRDAVAAVSVGLVQGRPVLDLDYEEDSACDADVNVIMTGGGAFVKCRARARARPSPARSWTACWSWPRAASPGWCGRRALAG